MTAPPHTNKVVDLNARAWAVRREGLLGTIRTRTVNRLARLVAELLEKADDTLFDFVQRAYGGAGNQDYFDAMRELRKLRAQVEQRYAEHLNKAFAGLEQRNLLEVDLERSLEQSRELSLVSEEQLEEQLGTSMVATSLTRLLGPVLNQLNHRLGIVAGVALDDKTNPVAPAHIAYAFRHALLPCEISVRIKVLLFKLYERDMARGLMTLYNEINHTLVEAGIAPEIKPTYTRPPQTQGALRQRGELDSIGHGTAEATPGEPGTVTLEAPPPGMRYVRVPETAAEQSIFTNLHQLLSGYRRMQGQETGEVSSIPGAPAVPQLASRDVLSILALFQREMPAGLQDAVRDPVRSIAQHLKHEVRRGAAKLGLNPISRLAPSDEDAIDLVGMLFDVLLDERDFKPDARQLIGRLLVPFVKVAMLDRRMFLLKTHPARRLLNALAEACESNSSETPQERELIARAKDTIDTLVADFNEDIVLFESLEHEFCGFVEKHQRRVAMTERRTAEAQRGKERLEHARSGALEELTALLDRHPVMSPGIESFLRRYWAHYLTLCVLRDDDGKEGKYAEAVGVGNALADLMALSSISERHAQFDALRPRIEPILHSSGCMGDTANEVFNSLRQALGKDNGSAPAAVESGQPESPDAPVSASTAEAADEAVDEAAAILERNAPPAPETLIEPESEAAPVATDFEQSDAEQIRNLEVGAWVQFTEDSGIIVPAKLSWVSPISRRMLFVNRRGLRYCVASPEELAVMMREGKLSIRQNDAAFEHAMSQVLGMLRSGAQEPEKDDGSAEVS